MIAGFTASYGYNATLNRGYAVSINKASDAALQQIIDAIVTYFVADIETPTQPAIGKTEDEILPLTDYYQSKTPMSQMMHTLLLRFVNVRRVTMKYGVLYSGNFLFGKQRRCLGAEIADGQNEGREASEGSHLSIC
jgi:hypothetical protein